MKKRLGTTFPNGGFGEARNLGWESNVKNCGNGGATFQCKTDWKKKTELHRESFVGSARKGIGSTQKQVWKKKSRHPSSETGSTSKKERPPQYGKK